MSEMLALVQQKKDARLEKERRATVLLDKRINQKVRHPEHLRLERCLRGSGKLKSVHVEVRNDSYWYEMRKKVRYNTTYYIRCTELRDCL